MATPVEDQGMKAWRRVGVVACILALAACSSGPVRRVSEPAASIQQLAVAADGRWTVELRINNYSSVPMRFDRVSLALTVEGESAGTLEGSPGITIGPESADLATLSLVPAPAARLRVGDALASRRSVQYAFAGRVDTAVEGTSVRSFDIERRSSLSPVPGLPGVMR
jgi:hypothetical protein